MPNTRDDRRSSPGKARVLGLVLLTSAAGAVSRADGPERLVPADGLAAYVEFDGLDAHADAWKATEARALLDGTPAGAMIADLARQVGDRLLKLAPGAGARLTGADAVALHEFVARHGFTLAVYHHERGASSSSLVLRGMGEKRPRERVERLLRVMTGPAAGKKPVAPKRIRGRDVTQVVEDDSPKAGGVNDLLRQADRLSLELSHLEPYQPDRKVARKEQRAVAPAPKEAWLSWWFEGEDLVLVAGPAGGTAGVPADDEKKKPAPATHADLVAAVLDAAEGKRPDVTTHPGRASALAEGKDVKGFEPDGLLFAELDAPGLFEALSAGLGGSTYRGLTLPSGRSMNDDVKVFPPGPDLPFANTQAATHRASAPPTIVPPPQIFIPAAVPAVPPGVAPKIEPMPPPPGEPGPTLPAPAPPPPSSTEIERKAVTPADAGPKADDGKEALDPAKVRDLDGVKRVVARWGFQGKALFTVVRVEAKAPRKGLVGLIDQPAFRKDGLPPLLREVDAFAVGSFDPGKGYEDLAGLLKPLLPGSVDAFETAVRDATGLRLREDVLNHLGPTWTVFTVPSEARRGDAEKKSSRFGTAVLAGVDDAGAFGKVLDAAAARANKALRGLEAGDGRGDDAGGKADLPMLALVPLKAPDRGYRLTSPAGLVFWLHGGVSPTVMVGKSFVAFAASPDGAREALTAEDRPGGRWRADGEVARALECLPERLTFLTVGDSRESPWPGWISSLPVLLQAAARVTGDGGDASASSFLAALGIPRPGGFRVRVDPDAVPKADDLAAHLFPSVFAAAADDRGLRVFAREALPFACLGDAASLKYSTSWTSGGGFKRDLKLKFGVGD